MGCRSVRGWALVGFAIAIAVWLIPSPGAAQDDWQVAPHSNPAASGASKPSDDWQVTSHGDSGASGNNPASNATPSGDAPDHSKDFVMACGEKARPAKEPVKSIMAEVASVWGAEDQVGIFESLNPGVPAHARPPGCIFYNLTGITMLSAFFAHVQDDKAERALIYAILAHELGHVMHRDFDPERQALGSVRCELEADHFAGYTLSRLNIRAENISDYYKVTGDETFGFKVSHGTREQREAALMDGWRRGESGLSEEATIGVGGTMHP
jgi:hypothetical protein